MHQKFYFEDGSVLNLSIDEPNEGTMAMIAYQKITTYVDEELLDDPDIVLESEAVLADIDEEDDELELDEDDLEDLDEEWVDDEEEFDDEWLDEDDDGGDEDWR